MFVCLFFFLNDRCLLFWCESLFLSERVQFLLEEHQAHKPCGQLYYPLYGVIRLRNSFEMKRHNL